MNYQKKKVKVYSLTRSEFVEVTRIILKPKKHRRKLQYNKKTLRYFYA